MPLESQCTEYDGRRIRSTSANEQKKFPRGARGESPPFVRRAGVKYILLWNEYFHYDNLGAGPGDGGAPFRRLGCAQAACYMTADRALMAPQHFDAVVFHMYYLRMRLLPFLNWGKFPPARSPQQR
ncbi:Protein of unknown function [Gryllus bimaculatus]|nr:Protein of unknown function [Gryllus bimaculatus]